MILAVDIDAVLNDLVEKWLLWINHKYNYYTQYHELKYYSMLKNFPTLTEEQIFEPFSSDDFLDSIEPTEGSRECLRYLNTQHDVYIVSATRPEHIKQKVEWLHRYFPYIPDRRMIFAQNKEMIKCDILIDDCSDNLIRDDCYTIQYEQPWNTQNRKWGDCVCSNWSEVLRVIEDMRKD